jgi:hypothetical protein
VDPRGWNTTVSPFLSERAQRRAPEVLAYAAVPGAAMLVSPLGEMVMFSGAAPEVDLARVARVATGLVQDTPRTFTVGHTCVHAAPIALGWTLCVLSSVGMQPGFAQERLEKASHVLELALLDAPFAPPGGDRSGDEGAPSQVFVSPVRARSN